MAVALKEEWVGRRLVSCVSGAHSIDRERPFRPNVITDSGDHEHALAGRLSGPWRAAWLCGKGDTTDG
jgi:hypothetical protein